MTYRHAIQALRYRAVSYPYIDADATSLKLYRLWRFWHTRSDPIVGFIHLSAATPAPTWQIDTFWVLPACRGYGLGTDLFHAACVHVQRQGARVLTIALTPDDVMAQPHLPAWLTQRGFCPLPHSDATLRFALALA